MDVSTYNKQLMMFREDKRLASFKKWIFDDNAKCNSAVLAEAGFYFIGNSGEPDAVQCFSCGKSLDGWEADDDPWKEHIKHANYCTFAKLKLPQHSLTVQQFMDIRKDQIQRILKKAVDDANKHEEDIYDKILNGTE